jgi:tRNA nucleotidyltransferase (CCA-adding enzyme)
MSEIPIRKPQSLGIEETALREALFLICESVATAGGRALVVGGSVRDAVLGVPAKDLDIEVYGIAPDLLLQLLTDAFRVDLVGQSFGVIKVHGVPIDVSIPRREAKVGAGHRGFRVLSDPTMSIEEAAARRDFTINAMAFDALTGQLLDPYGGLADLKGGVLRHTSQRFCEDPLRVLRGMQFAARFELNVAPETVALCRTIEPEGLPKERLYEEWRKLVLRGVRPSMGLIFLRDSGWIRYYPELEDLVDCEQDPDWHPEGDVWTHTLHSMDAFAESRTGEEWEDLVVGFAVLCHDFGKPATSDRVRGRIRSLGHESAGEEPTRAFLRRLTDERDLVREVVPLVLNHMRPKDLVRAQAGDGAIRRLARRVGRIDRLVRVADADQKGCPPRPYDGFPEGRWLMKRARELAVADSAPRPIVMGRHLIGLGLEPGPEFGPILRECYEAQIDGAFMSLDEGIAFAAAIAARRSDSGASGYAGDSPGDFSEDAACRAEADERDTTQEGT